jgi:hypothetical protein
MSLWSISSFVLLGMVLTFLSYAVTGSFVLMGWLLRSG